MNQLLKAHRIWLSALTTQVIHFWISMFKQLDLISVNFLFVNLFLILDDNKWQLVFDFTKDESGQKRNFNLLDPS